MLVYINRNKNNSPMRYFKARCPHCKTKFIFDLNDIRPYIDTVGTSVKCRICHKYKAGDITVMKSLKENFVIWLRNMILIVLTFMMMNTNHR